MHKAKIALGAIAAVGLTSAAVADHPYAFTGTKLETSLSGAEEVDMDGNLNAGDPDGMGIAMVWLNHGQSEICFDIMVTDIALPITGAHIHEAPAGSNGGVALGLSDGDADGNIRGCLMADQDLIKEIRKTPSDYYVNVHKSEYPGGAVRGQLRK